MGSPIDEKIRESHQRQFDYIQWRGINAIIKKKIKKVNRFKLMDNKKENR